MTVLRAALKTLGRTLVALLGVTALVACVQVYRNSGTGPVAGVAQGDGALRVATYNVHYIVLGRQDGPWSVADWERRKAPLSAAFAHIDADLVAFQEMESFGGGSGSRTNLTLEHLLAEHPGYGAAAQGDPARFPSTQPIFYRADRLEMTDQGWFFFSQTPDVIYSRTFNGSYPAFASWARFTDRQTGARFRAVNIHTDYASRDNRLRSAALVAARIAPWVRAGDTVLVLGDLNARHGDRTVEILEEAGVTFAPVRGATFHFNRGLNLFGAIDHIGWTGVVTPVGDPVVVRRKFLDEWPTDHYPVLQDLRLPTPDG